MLFLGLGACGFKVVLLAPPEWIRGNWFSGTTWINEHANMSFSYSDSRFSIGYTGDLGVFVEMETFNELGGDSYDRSTSTQYVLHIVTVHIDLLTWQSEDYVRDWTFTKLSTTQIEVMGANSGVFTRF